MAIRKFVYWSPDDFFKRNEEDIFVKENSKFWPKFNDYNHVVSKYDFFLTSILNEWNIKSGEEYIIRHYLDTQDGFISLPISNKFTYNIDAKIAVLSVSEILSYAIEKSGYKIRKPHLLKDEIKQYDKLEHVDGNFVGFTSRVIHELWKDKLGDTYVNKGLLDLNLRLITNFDIPQNINHYINSYNRVPYFDYVSYWCFLKTYYKISLNQPFAPKIDEIHKNMNRTPREYPDVNGLGGFYSLYDGHHLYLRTPNKDWKKPYDVNSDFLVYDKYDEEAWKCIHLV